MNENQEREAVFAELCVLYELALATGDSLDLQKTCDTFIRTLMSRKSFAVASIWLKKEILPEGQLSVRDEPPALVLISGSPRVQIRKRSLSLDHVIWQQVQSRGSFSCAGSDPLFSELITEKRIENGVFAVFPLGNMGFLKVYAKNRTLPLGEVELAQISTVLRKLAVSLQGCIDHEIVLLEVAQRKKAEKERESMAEQMQQTLRMESVGRLANGIAHDFNNLLVAVMGHAEILLLESAPNSAQRESLESILTAGRRGAGLTKQLLSFSRREPAQEIVLKPEALFQEVVTLLSPRVTHAITIEKEFLLGPRSIKGSPAELSGLLLNLGVNALDSMTGGGVLRLTTRELSSESVPVLEVSRLSPPAPWCELSVEDTGCGVPQELLKNIFDPFFTTKAAGKGTGLGLATAYSTAKQHGGHLCVQSEEGAGSKFTLYLPLLAEETSTETEDHESSRQSGTILLIDDDESARHTIAGMCRGLRWEVLEAEDGTQGIDIASKFLQKIDVVIVDMRMPGINGVETVRRLRALDSKLKIIVSSGFGDVEEMSAVSELGVQGMLQKPFRLTLLNKALQELEVRRD